MQPMNPENPHRSQGISWNRSSVWNTTKSITIVLLACFAFSSCAELEARRDIQKAGKLYDDSKFLEAINKYEEALSKADLVIGHHNLAITAYTAFAPGIESKSNLLFANKAIKHFQEYLKVYPDNQEIIGLMTTLWLNSNQLETALSYWQAIRKKNPTSIKAIGKVRNIHVQMKHFDEALQLDYLRVELTKDPRKKVLVLVQIGQLQYGRLRKKNLFDSERVKVADIGIAALQQALTLQPENISVYSLIAGLYRFRSMAHQTGWAMLADEASQRYYHLERTKKLQDAKKKKVENSKSADGASKNKEVSKEGEE